MSATTILSDNGVTSGSAGVKTSGGTDGTLQLQTTTAGGTATTALSIDNSQVITFTNQPTYTGGTANGVAYLNGSKVLTTGSALTFDGTTLGTNNALVRNGLLTIGTDTVYDAFINSPESMYFNVDSDNNAANNFYVWGTDRSGTSGGSELMRLTSTGLGIGTSSPSTPLHIYSVTQEQIRLGRNTTGSSGYITFYANNSSSAQVQYAGILGDVASSTAGSHGGALLFYTTGSGTSAERARIDSSGNLGVGTTSPNGKLSVAGNITLEPGGSGPVASSRPQLWRGADGFLGIQSGGDTGGVIAFHTSSSGTPSERARIDSSGNLLVGTTTAATKLTVNGNGYFAGTSVTGGRYIGFSNGTAGQECYVGNYLAIMGAGSSDHALIYSTNRVYALALTGGVYLATNGTSWTSASDERLKDIIEPISDASNKVSSLRAVIGKYKTDKDGTRRSFLIAQDVQAVLPEAVDASNPDELGVQYTDVIPLLVAAIKEQQAIIEQLKADVAALKGQA